MTGLGELKDTLETLRVQEVAGKNYPVMRKHSELYATSTLTRTIIARVRRLSFGVPVLWRGVCQVVRSFLSAWGVWVCALFVLRGSGRGNIIGSRVRAR